MLSKSEITFSLCPSPRFFIESFYYSDVNSGMPFLNLQNFTYAHCIPCQSRQVGYRHKLYKIGRQGILFHSVGCSLEKDFLRPFFYKKFVYSIRTSRRFYIVRKLNSMRMEVHAVAKNEKKLAILSNLLAISITSNIPKLFNKFAII